jgi:hypothetical protein
MEVRIYKNTSSEGIRSALSAFGRFSSIEIDEGKNLETNGSFLIFREIGFFEGLHRLIFESKNSLEEKRKNSRDHLYNFSKERPEIKKLLGSSIVEKEYWTVGEFREKLKTKTDFIRREKNNDLLHIPTPVTSQVGVIDAKSSKVKADHIIEWKAGPTKCPVPVLNGVEIEHKIGDIYDPVFNIISNGERKTVSIIHTDNPDDDEIRAAYMTALKDASGHVVIKPIYDIPLTEIKKRQPEYEKERIYKICSDQSIRILLEEIDSAVINNKDIRFVTIARGDAPDARFLPRVVGQRTILDEEKKRAGGNANLALMPDSLKLIKNEMEDQLQVRADELANIKLEETKIKDVYLCQAQPEMLGADTAFLDFESIERGARELKKNGKGQLDRVWNLSRDPRYITYSEVNAISSVTTNVSNIAAFEIPACELPASQVIALQSGSSQSKSSDAEKAFFINHLRNLTGRVVIEVRSQSTMRNGLLDALEELSKRPGGLGFVCVLASGVPEILFSLPDSLLIKSEQ